jgi:hypothetical protein
VRSNQAGAAGDERAFHCHILVVGARLLTRNLTFSRR